MAPLPELSANLAPVDAVSSTNASFNQDLPASLQFSLANSGSGGNAAVFNSFFAPQAGPQPDPNSPLADTVGPNPTPDPVVGQAQVHPIHKHRGILQSMFDVLGHGLKDVTGSTVYKDVTHPIGDAINIISSIKRLEDHLARMAQASGLGGAQSAATGAGGVLGAAGFVAGPEAMAAGAATAAAPGVIASLEHLFHGDLGKVWAQTSKGQTAGQMLADSVAPSGSIIHKVLSTSADFALASADDPTSYLGGLFDAARGAMKLNDAEKMAKTIRATQGLDTMQSMAKVINDHAPSRQFFEWAHAKPGPDGTLIKMNTEQIRQRAAASGAHLGSRTLVGIADATSPEEAINQFVKDVYGWSGQRSGIVDAIPALYKNKIMASIQGMHSWKGPSLFQQLPATEFSMDRADKVEEAVRQFDLWGADPKMIDQFHRALALNDNNTAYRLVQQAHDGFMTAHGLTEDQLDRMSVNGTFMSSEKMEKLIKKNQTLDPTTKMAFPGYDNLKAAEHTFGTKPIPHGIEEAMQPVTDAIKGLWLAKMSTGLRVAMDIYLNGMVRFGTHPMDMLGDMGSVWSDYLSSSPHRVQQFMGEELDKLMEHVSKVPGFSAVKPHNFAELPDQIKEIGFVKEEAKGAATRESRMIKKYLEANGADTTGYGYHAVGTLEHRRAALSVINDAVRNDPLMMSMMDAKDAAAGRLAGENYVKANGEKFNGELDMAHEILFGDPKRNIKPLIHPQLRPVLENGKISQKALKSIPDSLLPNVYGPNAPVIKTKFNPVGKMMETMHHINATVVNNMATQPIYNQRVQFYFDTMLQRAKDGGALDAGLIDEEDIAHMATQEATKDTLSVMHNPTARTKLDVMTKSYIPFLYAQTQFIKRWGKAFEKNPAAIRRMSILTNTLKQDGWFDQNDHGFLQWHIPVNNEFGKLILNTPFHFLTGHNMDLAFAQKFLSGGVKIGKGASLPFVPNIIPMSTDVMPGFSPTITIPAGWLTANALPTFAKPGVTSVEEHLFGPKFGEMVDPGTGFGQKVMGEIFPAWMNSLGSAISGDQRDNNYGSAVVSALQHAAFEGKDISDPKVQQAAKEQARFLFLIKSATQIWSPFTQFPNTSSFEAPTELRALQNTPKDPNDPAYKKILAKFGLTAPPPSPEAAAAAFMSYYTPQRAEAYIQGVSEATKGTSPSDEFQQFYQDHRDLFDKYPDIAAFLAPRGPFSKEAYDEQIRTGQRAKMNMTDWVKKVAIRTGDDEYYAKGGVKDRISLMQSLGFPSQTISKYRDQQYKILDEKYPGWRQWRLGANDRENARQSAIAQLTQAVNEKALNGQPGMSQLRDFVNMYNVAKNILGAQGVQSLQARSATAIRKILSDKYDTMKGQSEPLDEVYAYLFRTELEDFTTNG